MQSEPGRDLWYCQLPMKQSRPGPSNKLPRLSCLLGFYIRAKREDAHAGRRKSAWLYTRAWLVARVSARIPFGVFNRVDAHQWEGCPACGSPLDLAHALQFCHVLYDEPPTSWDVFLIASEDECPSKKHLACGPRHSANPCGMTRRGALVKRVLLLT